MVAAGPWNAWKHKCHFPMRSERGQVDEACNIVLLRCLMPVPSCPGMLLQALLMCG